MGVERACHTGEKPVESPGDERNGGRGRNPGDSGEAGRGGAATQRSAEPGEGAGEAVAFHIAQSQDLNR